MPRKTPPRDPNDPQVADPFDPQYAGRKPMRRVRDVETDEASPLQQAIAEATQSAAPTPAEPTPVPADDELTAAQQRIKELEARLAQVASAPVPQEAEPDLDVPTQPGSPDNILIHVLEDGFTAVGSVWYRGQEIEFDTNSVSYRNTLDRNGNTWLDLRNDDFAQMDRWGKVMFREGPWPGKRYVDAPSTAFQAFTGARPPTPEELARADEKEARRRRAVPIYR